jgi:protein XagA
MIRSFCTVSALVIAILVEGDSQICFAGAWAQQPGHGLAIATYRFYATGNEFDNSGWGITRFSNDGKFLKNEASLYLEYGLLKDVTLIGNFFFDQVEFATKNSIDRNAGFSDQQLALRWQFSHRIPQSFQFTVQFPAGYSLNDTPVLGNNQVDLELDYFVGGNFKLNELYGFWEAGAGYRYRTGAPADQIRWYTTLGIPLSTCLQILVQAEGTHGLGTNETQRIGNNVTVTTNYQLIKLSSSLIYKLTKSISLQVGPTFDFFGQNTGEGGGVQAAIWYTW